MVMAQLFSLSAMYCTSIDLTLHVGQTQVANPLYTNTQMVSKHVLISTIKHGYMDRDINRAEKKENLFPDPAYFYADNHFITF